MSDLTRFGIALDRDTLLRFDRLIQDQNLPNRSEAIRNLIRSEFAKREWETAKGNVVCVLSIVYDHHQRGVVNKLLKIQHDQPAEILCTQHVHLDHHRCLEVIIAKGEALHLRDLAGKIKSTKGIQFTGLTLTSAGEES